MMPSNQQLLDDQDHKPKITSTSVQLLVASSALIGVMIIPFLLQWSTPFINVQPLFVLLSFTIVIVSGAGVAFGLTERKLKHKRIMIGIVGNLTVFLVFATLLAFAFT